MTFSVPSPSSRPLFGFRRSGASMGIQVSQFSDAMISTLPCDVSHDPGMGLGLYNRFSCLTPRESLKVIFNLAGYIFILQGYFWRPPPPKKNTIKTSTKLTCLGLFLNLARFKVENNLERLSGHIFRGFAKGRFRKSASSKPTRICTARLSRVKGRSSPARGYKFGCVCPYMASHYVSVMTPAR